MNHQHEHEMQHAVRTRSAYVNAIVSNLWMMPTGKRAEAARELASHIEMLVAEEQLKGRSPLEATNVALRQFGPPNSVGRQVALQWFKSDSMKTPRAWILMAGATVILAHQSLVLFTTIGSLPLASRGVFLKESHLEFHNGVSRVVSEGPITGINPFYMNLAANTFYLLSLVVAGVLVARQLRREPSIPVR